MADGLRVLIVDDSPFVCAVVSQFLAASEDVTVVGTAHSGEAALRAVHELKPDVVTLDLEMPGWNGLETLRRIMGECPTPVVVVSGLSRRGAQATLEAIQCGAVDFLFKYTPRIATDPEVLRRDLASKVRNAARIRVVRTVRRPEQAATDVPLPSPRSLAATGSVGEVVIIGASTGGPVALRELLSELPSCFPHAVIVVQHMPREFTCVLAAQLDRSGVLPAKEAEGGELLSAGTVLVAPGGSDLLIGPDGAVQLMPAVINAGHGPSIDRTLLSAVERYGCRAWGVVLTGIGADGAAGLLAVRRAGGRTFAQDLTTCIVPGMPARAAELGAVEQFAPPRGLGRLLATMALKDGRRERGNGDDHEFALCGARGGTRPAAAL